MEKVEKLKKMLELLQNDTITPKEMEKFVMLLVDIVKKGRDENAKTSEEIKEIARQTIEYLNKENSKILGNIEEEGNKRLLVEKQAKEALRAAQEAMQEIKGLYIPEEIDKEEIIQEALDRMPKCEMPEIEEETGKTIVEKINELPETGEKIDASHIKNLPTTIQRVAGFSRFKGLIAGSNITITEDKLGYPEISAIGEGTGDMTKAVYDPNGKNADVFDYNNLENTPTIPDAQIQSDWNQADDTKKDFIKNKPTIPSEYTLPTASVSVKGGIKIGDRLTIDENGVLSADIQGGTGAVDSVNGKTGAVVLDYSDVGAAPALGADDNYVTDEEKTAIGTIGNKVDKVTGKGLSTNDYTTAEQTKLSGVETGADVTDAGNVGSSVNGSDAKTTMADADKIAIIDTEASNVLKTLSWSYVKSILKTYLDSVYQAALGYTAENSANKKTTLADNSDTYYPTQKAVKTAVDAKQDSLGFTPENAANKGQASGYAELDVTGKVPSAQLPSYVDDVLEYANLAGFPVTGETGKIYVALDTNLTYRWSGSAYVEISASLALGETSATAYRGDRGKSAYDHSQLTTGNPHSVTKSDVGLGNVTNDAQVKASDKAAASDLNTGTDNTKYITADALAGSNLGRRVLMIPIIDNATALATGDGKWIFPIPVELNGMNLVQAEAYVDTVSSSGTSTFQIRNVTDSVDMLSTLITIDASENSSYTAATRSVVDTTKDDVATGDRIAIDVDGVGTGTKGLQIILSFQLP